MKNKPTKWGFKLWVLADRTGYTVDFDIYTGKSTTWSQFGFSNNLVMQLSQPLDFQGYEIYCDNIYSSPGLFHNLLQLEIYATGSFCIDRCGLPGDVVLKTALEKSKVSRGTGLLC